VFLVSYARGQVGTALATCRNRSAIEMGRLVEGASLSSLRRRQAGREPRTGEAGSQEQVRLGTLNTARAGKGRGRRGRSQGRPRRPQRRTGGRTISRGDRAARGLNNLGPLRIRVRSKALKARARFWSPWVKLGAGSGLERQEGNGERRARAAVRGGNPLKREPRTWQRGETNPQGRWRRKPSRTCETSRAERCGPGTSAAWMGQPIR